MIAPSFRHLRHLTALAEHRHFGRAAVASSVTQSTLSASIKELERLLEATLVDRSKRRVVFTGRTGAPAESVDAAGFRLPRVRLQHLNQESRSRFVHTPAFRFIHNFMYFLRIVSRCISPRLYDSLQANVPRQVFPLPLCPF